MVEQLTLKYIPLAQAQRWDRNPKRHDIGAICRSIELHGFRDPPAYDAALDAFVEGNGRTDALEALWQQKREPPRGIAVLDDGGWALPVLFGVDARSRLAAEAYGIDHNNLTLSGGDFDAREMARLWDEDVYTKLLADLADNDVMPVSVDGDDLDALLGLTKQGDGGDDFDATPEDGPTRTQAGDLWLIGGVHRLIVGDSTDPVTVARLMGGERAQGVFTSPPYDQQRTYEGNMAPDWRALVSGVCLTMLPFLDPEAQVFINLGLVHRGGRVIRYWDGLIEDLEAADWPLFGWYVWDKLNGMPGDWNGRLAPAHEWVFHFARENVRPEKTVESKHGGKVFAAATWRNPDGSLKGFTRGSAPVQSHKIPDSVIRVDPAGRAKPYGDHPAPFPVLLPQMFLEAYDAALWYEPFMGSGTTLIAAHRTGRRCYGVEIEPKYADVILRRAEAEGLTCERAEV